jgi:ERCC4-type nuclease
LASGYKYLSAELMDSFRLLRSISSSKEIGTSGVMTLTSKLRVATSKAVRIRRMLIVIDKGCFMR